MKLELVLNGCLLESRLKMIKIKYIVEITGKIAREELKPEYEKMSLRELRKILLNNAPEWEHNIQDTVGVQNKVRIKNAVVTEE